MTDWLADPGGVAVDAQVSETDAGGVVQRDLTPYLIMEGSTVERDSCSETGHLTARLRFRFGDGVDVPEWSAVRFQLRIAVSSKSSASTTGYQLFGLLIPETPRRMADQQPPVWEVDCHDTLTVIAGTAGRTFSVPAGSVGLNVSRILGLASQIRVDPALTAISATTAARQWPIDNQTSYLLAIDHLLEAVGWRPPWTDTAGRLTSAEFVDPATLPATAHIAGNLIGLAATAKDDTYGTPNQAVFVRNTIGHIPSEGAGVYTVNNVSTGPASQQARDGRVVSAVYGVDVASQAALVAYGQRAAMKVFQVPLTVCLATVPRLDLWHRDVVTIDSPDLDFDESDKFIVDKWSLPLNGGLMDVVLAGVGPVAIPPPPAPDTIRPGLVRNLDAYFSPAPSARVIIDWDPPASGAGPFTYQVERDAVVIADDLTVTSWTDATSGAGGLYSVRARNHNGLGTAQNVGPIRVSDMSAVKPSAVQMLQGMRTQLGPPNVVAVVLTWQEPSRGDNTADNPITYDVFRWPSILARDVTVTTYHDNDPPSGSVSYGVRPRNDAGSGPTTSVTVGA